MNLQYSVNILPTDLEKQPDHLLDGYKNASSNGFFYGKNKEDVIEILEIEGQQFRRYIPSPPLHSKQNYTYSQHDLVYFPCSDYPNHILFSGPLEEERVLQQRKKATELKTIVEDAQVNQQKVDTLTSQGDLATSFQLHEKVHISIKKATDVMTELANNIECNSILLNTLEFKMKAAGDISEYEQAQKMKKAMESYASICDSVKNNLNSITYNTLITFSEALDNALQLSNYLTD